MIENLDELIDINLKIVFNSANQSTFIFSFKNIDGKPIITETAAERVAEYMEEFGLIKLERTKRKRADLDTFGLSVMKEGGWLEHLKLEKERLEKKEQEKNKYEKKIKEKEEVELRLALSNIEANKLNAKVAKRNKYSTLVNIIIGALNLGLLFWQIFIKTP